MMGMVGVVFVLVAVKVKAKCRGDMVFPL